MKRLAFVLSIVAAAVAAAPLSAQSRNDGPWWDPANTGRTTTDRDRSGTIYDRNGRVDDRRGTIYRDSDIRRADGRWRAQSRDRNGNIIYVRSRVSGGNLIVERATRDRLGRYRVIDRRIAARNVRLDRNGNVISNDRRNRNDDRWDDRRDRNDDGHWDNRPSNRKDNGNHYGWEKGKGNKNKRR